MASARLTRRSTRFDATPAPFAVLRAVRGADRIHCLNAAAETAGLSRGQGVTDARAICPDLVTAPSDLRAEQRFLLTIARWMDRYAPFVAPDGEDALVLDISGAAHLFGGEEALLEDMADRLSRAGLEARLGCADTRGAAWALAHFAPGIAPPGATRATLARLTPEALRIDADTATGLRRLGLDTIDAVANVPRISLARRFGTGLTHRLDRVLGAEPDPISPLAPESDWEVSKLLQEPVGTVPAVMAVLEQLLEPLCLRLEQAEQGARQLSLHVRRTDHTVSVLEVGLARPMRDVERILGLFAKGVEAVDAGFGIEHLRLVATSREPLRLRQLTRAEGEGADHLSDLISRIAGRVGFEHVLRYLPGQSHLPEHSFIIAPAAYSEAAPGWPASATLRPLVHFPPEPLEGQGPRPPKRFRWRGMRLTLLSAEGPERISPEWWLDRPAWRSGVRDYWRVEARKDGTAAHGAEEETRRLWLFHTPQTDAWSVQGVLA
ncbi:MAG: DNA polymerase Y family protein [Pseudomonadota bacterium]